MGKPDLALVLRRAYVRIAVRLAHMGLTSLIEFSAGMGLDEIKAEYAETLYSAMTDYLASNRPVTAFRNEFRRACNDAFTLAFYAGWADAGATGPITDEAQAWLNNRIEQEIAFADELFEKLKLLRADKETSQGDKESYCQLRSDGYTASLDGVYAEGKMMGDEEQELEFGGDDGRESCSTCQSLKGEKHPAKWWTENNLVLRPGNTEYECGCWACAHTLTDKDGNVWAHGGGY